MRRNQCEDRRGDRSGTGTISRRRPMIARGRHHHAAVREHVGTADLVGLTDCLVAAQHPHEGSQGVAERDRLGAGLDPAWGDHHREPLDELPQDLPADPPVADHQPGPQGRGRSAGQQDRLDLTSAPQVLGQVVRRVPQAAQVDDLGQARVRRRTRTHGHPGDPRPRSRPRPGSAPGSRRRPAPRGPPASPSGSPMSKRTGSPTPLYCSGLRVSAVTSCPASARAAASPDPTKPVAPDTATRITSTSRATKRSNSTAGSNAFGVDMAVRR